MFSLNWQFWYFPRVGGGLGGWVGQIKIKDHLSPAEAEVGPEIGKNPQHQ